MKIIEVQWKDIAEYEGIYKVSNFGEVYRYSRSWYSGEYRRIKKTLPEGLVSQRVTKYGYKVCTLCKDGIKKTKRVHRLVAEAFIDNPENKSDVNHIDGNKENNCVYNLEWCTPKENTTHAIKNGLANPHHKKKIDRNIADDIRSKYYNDDIEISQLAKEYNLNIRYINRIIKYKHWI